MPKVVISYAHEDHNFLSKLTVHLMSLERTGQIDSWSDRKINPGQDFNQEIEKQFDSADIILLLVSPDFIASDFCYNTEMSKALERHKNQQAVVIPVILRPCNWKKLPFAKLKAVPYDGMPIASYKDIDSGFLEVVEAVRDATKSLDNTKTTMDGGTSVLPSSNMSGSDGFRKSENLATPRSKNLQIRKKFTDKDFDVAMETGMSYVCSYFKNSLEDLEKQNEQIHVKFRSSGSDRFEATIYQNGQQECICGIWLDQSPFQQKEIRYNSWGLSTDSYNYSFVAESNKNSIKFRTLIGRTSDEKSDYLYSKEEMAEFFWSCFIEPIQ